MAGISPWVQGQQIPLWVLTLTIEDGQTVVDLTDATAAELRFGPILPSAAVAFTGSGTATLLTPLTNGQIQYAVAASDVKAANVGRWQIQVVVTFPTGPMMTDPLPWTLVEAV